MLFSALKLIGETVLTPSGTSMETVQGLIVGAREGKIMALRLADHRLVLFTNVSVVTPQQIIAREAAPPKVPQDGLEILKHRVVTEDGKSLGQLWDFHFDQESGLIMLYRVRVNKMQHLLSKDLIIPRQKVIAIEEKQIIVQDLVLKGKNPLRRLLDKEERLPSPSQAAAT